MVASAPSTKATLDATSLLAPVAAGFLLGLLVVQPPVRAVLLPLSILASGAIVLAVSRHRRVPIVAPGILLVATWTVALAAANLKLWTIPGNQTEALTGATWLFLLSAVFAFLAGVRLGRRSDGVSIKPGAMREALRKKYDWRVMTWIAGGMYAVGFATWLYFAIQFRSVTGALAPAFTEDTAATRLFFKLPTYGYLYALLVPAVILSVLGYLVVGPRRPQLILLALVPVALLLMSSAGVRSDSTRALIVSAILALLVRKPRMRTVLMGVGAVLLVFALVNIARLSSTSTQRSSERLPQNITTLRNQEMATLYLYLGTAPNNFQTFLEEEGEQKKYGGVLARSILSLVGLDHLSEVQAPKGWSVSNTMTWIGSYYLDFGAVGVVVIPLVLGLVTGKTYRRMVQRRTLGMLLLYAFLAEAIILSTSTDRFFESSTIFFLVVCGIVSRFSRRSGAITRAPRRRMPAALAR